MWRAPKLLDRLKYEYEMKTSKEQRVGARSLAHALWGSRGVLELRDGIRKIDK
jgi:hypothetical protein